MRTARLGALCALLVSAAACNCSSSPAVNSHDASTAAGDAAVVPGDGGQTAGEDAATVPPCTPNDTRQCGSNVGECKQGTQTCQADFTWGTCQGEVGPQTEICNGLDDNCDGTIDEGCSCTDGDKQACGSNVGECRPGLQTCAGGAWGACVGAKGPQAETCNGLDDNCDGTVDEGCSCVDGAKQGCGSNVGECRPGQQTCAGGAWGACVGAKGPQPETCNGLDDNCDGNIDEGCSCQDGHTQPCGSKVGECKQGTQTCTGGAWGACTGTVGPATEICNDLDDNCDGVTDEGCDDDKDGYCDKSMTVVGTPAVCPRSPANTGDDCDDANAAIHPGATEICNDLDDNCDGATDEGCDADHDGYCTGAMTVVGTPASCPHSAPNTGDDCNDANAAIHPGATEICNDLDDNCNGVTDEGCDDDKDGYCDAAMVVVGTPAICPHSAANTGDDCDDTNAAVHPGAAEICTDGIDNNCDKKVDLVDAVACPAITVHIQAWADPTQVSHGSTQPVTATLTPNDPGPGNSWPRVWKIVDAQPAAGCAVGDVTLAAQTDAAGTTSVPITMPNTFAKQDCVYTLQVTVNGYAKDTARYQMVNRKPQISVTNAIFDGIAWRLVATAGTKPSVTATATDADGDHPIGFNWTGADLGKLSCALTTCVSSDNTAPYSATVTWGSAVSPGSFKLVVSAGDGFDPTPATANIVVDVDSCVWVSLGASGTGATAASPLGTIMNGLAQAKASAGTTVCVIGNATYPEDVVVPATPHAPNLAGGFDATGALSNLRPLVSASVAAGMQFEAGYGGTVRHLGIARATTVVMPTGPTAAVTIKDASPELLDCTVTSGAGLPPTAIAVLDDPAVGAATAPRIVSCTVNNTAAAVGDTTGIRISRDGGGAATASIVGTPINLTGTCTTVCRGIHVKESSVSVTGGSSIQLFVASGSAIGIDVEGSATNASSAVVTNNGQIGVATQNGDQSIAVRLDHANRVTVSDNQGVGAPWNPAGRKFAAGIADGMILRDGTLTRGSSSLVTVERNHMIAGGSGNWAQDCNIVGANGESVDVTAGVFLAGTSNVTLRDNGRPSDQMAGIYGGGSTIYWTPATRRLPPTAVGVWLVDTSGVTLDGNEIRAGGYGGLAHCTPPAVMPEAAGWLDGIPPNPAFGVAAGSLPSQLTKVDRNGISCARPPENGGVGIVQLTWCIAAELNVPGTNAPVLTNNYLAATKGNFLIGLWQRGGHGVIAANNTFDADLMMQPWDPPPLPNSIRKRAIELDGIDAAGITLVNNVVWTHKDDPYDLAVERLCILEKTTGTTTHIGTLQNNLFYIQNDNLLVPAAPYVRVNDGTTTVDYASDKLNTVAGVGTISGNFAAIPGLSEPSVDWQKSQSRLSAGAAAIDKGLPVGGSVPDHDMDKQTRPQGAGVDVGHDEL